jgi:cell division protein FtsB
VIDMAWLPYLLVLICPLMMIFMMKGHGGGHQHHDSQPSKDLGAKMSNLELENEKLRKEINDLSSMMNKGS